MTWGTFFILFGISVAFSMGLVVGYAIGERPIPSFRNTVRKNQAKTPNSCG